MLPKRIVVTQNMDLCPEQEERLKSLGEVRFYRDIARTPEEWLGRCRGADIVCSGKFGLREKIYELPNTFFSLPFVDIGWLDRGRLKKNSITVAYSPGCNRDAVSEWIIGMMIALLRKLPAYVNAKEPPALGRGVGLTGKKVCILGAGNIGSRVGKVCEAFGMRVKYFRRGDDLHERVKDADIVINCLTHNPGTEGLLGKEFFGLLKKGSYFITVTSEKVYDVDAMLEALDKNVLAGAATDAAGIQAGDVNDPVYGKLRGHKKVLATPHIAFLNDVTARVCNDMMIGNIEAWLGGRPINIVG